MSGSEEDHPVVETSMGKVRGRKMITPDHPDARQSFRFAAIPFAKPPVGELRFEPPQKNEPWEGVLDGLMSKPSPEMPKELMEQLNGCLASTNEFGEEVDAMSEDCLYLNVYTANPNPSKKMPVLFWIYGGGFQIGGQKSYDGNVLTSLHDVVVVIPNYRVSAFGFLSVAPDAQGNSPCRGNMGLLDQKMALEWVRDNIGSFGGDPSNVVIFGESAGSISVSLHVHSPLSAGLFHKAIGHSGVCDFPIMVREDNVTVVERLLKELDINDSDPNVRFQKLKKVPAKTLTEISGRLCKEFQYFCPIFKDGVFFPDDLRKRIESGSFSRIPYILGCNNTEGFGIIAPGRDQGFVEGLSEETAMGILNPITAMMAPKEKVEVVKAAVIKEYSRGLDTGDKMYWSRLIGMMSADMNFVISSIKMAGLHADSKSATFFYLMTQSVRYNHSAEYNLSEKPELKAEMCECDHADDINFTFGLPLSRAPCLFPVKFTPDETRFSETWMSYLVNFAHTGNPNRGPKKMELEWPQYSTEKKAYLQASASASIERDLQPERVLFWNRTLPGIVSQ